MRLLSPTFTTLFLLLLVHTKAYAHCFVDIDLSCRPPTNSRHLYWEPKSVDIRKRLFESGFVQKTEAGCNLFGHLIRTECGYRKPLQLVYIDPATQLQSSLFILQNNPDEFKDLSKLPTAFRAYFEDSGLTDVVLRYFSTMKEISFVNADAIYKFVSDTTNKDLLKVPAKCTPQDNASVTQSCGYEINCRHISNSQVGEYIEFKKTGAGSQVCSKAQILEHAFKTVTLLIKNDTPDRIVASINQPTVNNYSGFSHMPLIDQVNGWIQGLTIEKYNANIVPIGLCLPTSATMMALALKRESPNSILGNRFDIQPNSYGDGVTEISDTTKPNTMKSLQYSAYATWVDEMLRWAGFYQHFIPGSFSLYKDIFPQFEHRNPIKGYDATYVGVGDTDMLYRQYQENKTATQDYVENNLTSWIRTKKGVVLGLQVLAKVNGASPAEGKIGHANVVRAVDNNGVITLHDPWGVVNTVKFSNWQSLKAGRFIRYMTREEVNDCLKNLPPGMDNYNCGYVGAAIYGDDNTYHVLTHVGAALPGLGAYIGQHIEETGDMTAAYVSSYMMGQTWPQAVTASKIRQDNLANNGLSEISTTGQSCTPLTRGEIVVENKRYTFLNPMPFVTAVNSVNSQTYQSATSVTAGCMNLYAALSSTEVSSDVTNLLGTYKFTCQNGSINITQNNCSSQSLSCNLPNQPYGQGLFVPTAAKLGNQTYYPSASGTCQLATCNQGFTVNYAKQSCDCIFKELFSNKFLTGTINNNSLCEFKENNCPANTLLAQKEKTNQIYCIPKTYVSNAITGSPIVNVGIRRPPDDSNPFTSCSVHPPLPPGLALNRTTCTISGTPIHDMPLIYYTITGTTDKGQYSQGFGLDIGHTLPSSHALEFFVNQPIITRALNASGTTGTPCTVTPAFPTGIQFNPAICQISGTPTQAGERKIHYLSYSSLGNTFNAQISTQVLDTVPDAQKYNYSVGLPISNLIFQTESGAVSNCSVSPQIPSGLTFNSTTCTLSGTPNQPSNEKVYLLTSSDPSGIKYLYFSIQVEEFNLANVPDERRYVYPEKIPMPPLQFIKLTGCQMVTPLPAGLSMDFNSCTVSGLPADDRAEQIYIFNTNSGASYFSLKVEPFNVKSVPDNLKYKFPVGIPIPPISINTDHTKCFVTPNLPLGLSFEPGTCRIVGTPTQLTSLEVYVVTPEKPTEYLAVTIEIVPFDVNAVPILDSNKFNFTQNVPISTIVTNLGASCTVQPALPPGLVLNTTTCTISGTGTAARSPTLYTIKSSTQVVYISIEIAPVSLSSIALGNRKIFERFKYIAPLNFSNNGQLSNCTSQPALPRGLTLNNSSCILTGVPEVISAQTIYLISGRTVGNVVGTTHMTIQIKDFDLNNLADGNIFKFTLGVPIGGLGFGLTNCTLTPSLPNGLSFNSATCMITGTPTELSSPTVYAVFSQINSNQSINSNILLEIANRGHNTIPTDNFIQLQTNEPTRTLVLKGSGDVALTNCTIQPTLPAGLLLDTSSCSISGTPKVSSVPTVYSLQGLGQDDVSYFPIISIEVIEQKPKLPLQFDIQPQNISTVAGQKIEIPFSVSGSSSIQYSLLKIVSNTKYDMPNYRMLTDPRIVIQSPTSGIAGTYVVRATAGNTIIDSTPFTISIISPTFSLGVNNISVISVIEGSQFKFSFTHSANAPVLWTWKKDGIVLPNQTSSTLTLDSLQLADSGDYGFEAKVGSQTFLVNLILDLTVLAKPSLLNNIQHHSFLSQKQIVPLQIKDYSGNQMRTCMVQPSLPFGLSLDPSNCVITGTPTTLQSTQVYTISGTRQNGTNSYNQISIDVQLLDLSLDTPESEIRLVKDILIHNLQLYSEGVALTDCEITPALNTSLAFDKGACQFNGTPTLADDNRLYKITSTKNNTQTEMSLLIRIQNEISTHNNYNFLVGYSIPLISLYTQNAPISQCQVTPALPPGLILESTTCTITGAPQLMQNARNYILAGLYGGKLRVEQFKIEVKASVGTNQQYSYILNTVLEDTLVDANHMSGDICQISPDLPLGMDLDPNTCTLSGEASELLKKKIFNITRESNDVTFYSQISIEVVSEKINGVTPEKVIVLAAGAPAPEHAFYDPNGNKLSSCTVSPILPSGLKLTNCELSGTPTQILSRALYQIRGLSADQVFVIPTAIEIRLAQIDVPIYSFQQNNVITDTALLLQGYAISNCSASSTLPSGLSLSASCVLSGTPTLASPLQVYRVNAKANNISYNLRYALEIRSPNPPALDPMAASATINSASQVTLNWQNGGGNTHGYRISYLTGAQAPPDCTTGVLINESLITGLTHVLSGLNSKTTYSFRICAINDAPAPVASSGVTLTATTLAEPPPNPSGLTALSLSTSQLQLSWVTGGGSTVKYKFSYAVGITPPASCEVGTQVIETTNVQYLVAALTPNTVYSFRVCALNDNPNIEMSTGVVITATTQALPNEVPTFIITAQPRYAETMASQTLTLNVQTSITASVQYQWYFNNNPIIGAISASLVIPAADYDLDGEYIVLARKPGFSDLWSERISVKIKRSISDYTYRLPAFTSQYEDAGLE